MESKAILSTYGIPINDTVPAASAAEAAYAAQELGYPVVLKILSPDITHKSDEGGIRFYLRTQSDVKAAYEQIVSEAQEHYPEAKLLGVTVQAQERRPDRNCTCHQAGPAFRPDHSLRMGWSVYRSHSGFCP